MCQFSSELLEGNNALRCRTVTSGALLIKKYPVCNSFMRSSQVTFKNCYIRLALQFCDKLVEKSKAASNHLYLTRKGAGGEV